MQDAIAKLSPSAARLLLAFMTRDPETSFEEVVKTAGIGKFQTYIKAKDELLDKGIFQYENGQIYLAPYHTYGCSLQEAEA